MGVQTSKSREAGDEIISKRSLVAVKETVKFLKQNARAEGLFRRSGRRYLRRQILSALKKGRTVNFEDVHGNGALECAAALQIFLSRLKQPVMPLNIQQLILADNPGIAANQVALDALGLIRQDVRGRHGELLADILDLLSYLTHSAPPSERSELQGSPLPVALLPVFFHLTPDDLIKWKRLAGRFSELITEAPECLLTNSAFTLLEDNSSDENFDRRHASSSREERIQNRNMTLRGNSMFYPLMRLGESRNHCALAC